MEPTRDFGPVTGVYVNRDRPVGFGFKALIGGGEADHWSAYSYAQPRRGGQPIAVSGTSFYHASMFVFEPEANVVVHLNQHLKLTGGVGYRLTGDPYYGYYGYYGYSNGPISGVTGSVGLQISGGSVALVSGILERLRGKLRHSNVFGDREKAAVFSQRIKSWIHFDRDQIERTIVGRFREPFEAEIEVA